MNTSLYSLYQHANVELERRQIPGVNELSIPWLLLRGVHELNLWGMIDTEILDFVNSPISQSSDDDEPLSILMTMSYENYFGTSISTQLHKHSVRKTVLEWFSHTGLAYFDAEPYLSSNPLAFVQERVKRYFPAEIAGVPGVNLVGYAHAASGLGEQLRSIATCLQANGIPYSLFNIPHSGDRQDSTTGLAPSIENSLRYPITLYCLNAFETERFWRVHGDLGFANRYNIGLFPWELPQVPAEALHALTLMNEIWAISQFNARAYKAAGHREVIHMRPLINKCMASRSVNPRAPKPFRFLNVFDAQSYVRRKNAEAAVTAFQLAFPQARGDHVQLQIKITNANWADPGLQLLSQASRADRRIELIDENMSAEKLNKLFSYCDCYISLHRSEGFGYTIAEAMWHGKPVIATDWSGSTDLLNNSRGLPVSYKLINVEKGDYPFSQGQQWADPDIDDAASKMLRIFRMPKQARDDFGDAAQQYVQKNHLGELAQNIYAERIQEIYSVL